MADVEGVIFPRGGPLSSGAPGGGGENPNKDGW